MALLTTPCSSQGVGILQYRTEAALMWNFDSRNGEVATLRIESEAAHERKLYWMGLPRGKKPRLDVESGIR